VPVAEGAGVTTEEDDFAGAGVRRVPAGDTELRGLPSAVGFAVIVGLVCAVGPGVAADGDVAGAGVAEDGVVAGVTPVVAAGGGLTSR
jgi:hypothetical protein